jgi:hypothetical protein
MTLAQPNDISEFSGADARVELVVDVRP